MAQFSVRVELHGATSKDYEQLHEAMDDAGFVRYIIIDENNKKMKLPTAEYNFSSPTHTNAGVHSLASDAVASAMEDNLPHIRKLNIPPMIVVTKSAGRYVSGLETYVEKK